MPPLTREDIVKHLEDVRRQEQEARAQLLALGGARQLAEQQLAQWDAAAPDAEKTPA